MSDSNELRERLTLGTVRQSSVSLPGEKDDAFQERIRALIKDAGTAAELSRKCGIPESTIKKWADGTSDPSRQRCVALAWGMNVSLAWLVAGEGEMRADASQEPSQSQSQSVRLDYGTLAQAVGLLEGLLIGRGRLDPGDYATALIGFYEALQPDAAPKALPSTVVSMSAFVATHAKQGS